MPTLKGLGRDVRTHPFLAVRRMAKGMEYGVNWDYTP